MPRGEGRLRGTALSLEAVTPPDLPWLEMRREPEDTDHPRRSLPAQLEVGAADRTRMVTSKVVRLDRCAGVLVGLAAGDALGAGYEFGPICEQPEMIGGGLGPWEPGEWTDDTQMAICIAEVAARGDLDPVKVGARFLAWFAADPKDVGILTRSVLSSAAGPEDLTAVAGKHFADFPGSSAGNGSLMRTAPVALAALGDDRRLVALATQVSDMTHGDPLAAEACVLWCVAIDRAVRESRLDGILDGLDLLAPDRREWWAAKIDEARKKPAGSFNPNGFVVTALQAALAAIWQTPVPEERPCGHLVAALEAAVRIGHDTDTVAAIAGGLLGARWGASAVPTRWRVMLHGWPGYRVRDLARLAVLCAQDGPDRSGWPSSDDMTGYYDGVGVTRSVVEALAEDPGVILANIKGIGTVEADVIVSLCRVGTEVPTAAERVEVWLIDEDDPDANPNLDSILVDLARSIVAWRQEGQRVAIHCVQAERRTPAVAAAYLAQRDGISGSQAWDQVAVSLPGARRNPAFAAALARLWPGKAN
jgi:ADP-ribosyl-[dinitrogen reductase] hydrolase